MGSHADEFCYYVSHLRPPRRNYETVFYALSVLYVLLIAFLTSLIAQLLLQHDFSHRRFHTVKRKNGQLFLIVFCRYACQTLLTDMYIWCANTLCIINQKLENNSHTISSAMIPSADLCECECLLYDWCVSTGDAIFSPLSFRTLPFKLSTKNQTSSKTK